MKAESASHFQFGCKGNNIYRTRKVYGHQNGFFVRLSTSYLLSFRSQSVPFGAVLQRPRLFVFSALRKPPLIRLLIDNVESFIHLAEVKLISIHK